MFVKDWMSTKVISIDVDGSMQEAISLIKEHRIRMLPVLKKGKLVGVLSDSDLKRASASDATLLDIHEALYLISKIKVKDIMTKKPITVPPDFTVEEAAEVLLTNKISGVPVVDEKTRLVGVITRDDLFKVLISLCGLGKRGILFGFQVEDRPGSIKELTDVIRIHGGRIASILSSYERVPAGYRVVYVRAYDIKREELPTLREELNNKTTMLSIVDHGENKREVFRDLLK
jgi:acetoin utilization protein AcuB